MVKFRKPPFERRAPIMDMKGKIKRGLNLERLGRVWKMKKYKAGS